jgi:hypothetical protein
MSGYIISDRAERAQGEDELWLCRAEEGRRCTKLFKAGEALPYDAGMFFETGHVCVRDLVSLEFVLRAAARCPDHLVVRGQLREGVDPERVQRTLKDQYKLAVEGDPRTKYLASTACFEEVDRRWLCLDLDKWLWPAGVLRPEDGGDPWEGLMVALRALPAPFRRASCVVQWSSSAGVNGWDVLKCHVWFWADRAVCSASLRDYFKAYNVERYQAGLAGVDLALFNAVQVHYCADPLFEGVADPLAAHGRWRRLEGAHDTLGLPGEIVGLATHEAAQAALMEQRRIERGAVAIRAARVLAGSASDRAKGVARYVSAALTKAVTMILDAGEGARHETLRDQALSLYGLVLAGALDEGRWEQVLWDAAEATLPAERIHSGEVQRLIEGARVLGTVREIAHVGAGVAR